MVVFVKVLFLDVDGVLNSREFFENRESKSICLDESRFPLLQEIINKTGAKIVLSSTWRYNFDFHSYQQLPQMLAKYKMEIMDFTGRNDAGRGAEISDWLAKHPEVDIFCIIDDDSFDMGEYIQNRLVQTSFTAGRGIERKHVDQAIKILNGGVSNF